MGLDGITLTKGVSTSLLAVKKTAKQLDEVKDHLASGKKIANALDNPTSFFAAQQLKNHADDLSQIHDGIRESIHTVNAAGNGITATKQLVTQMKAIVESAKNTSDPLTKSALAKTFDQVYAQLNYVVTDSSYRGTNLIGDKDPRLLTFTAEDLPVSLNANGTSEYVIKGQFLGTGYALYEDGVPDIGWVANDDGSKIAPVTADTTEFPTPTLVSAPLDFVFVIDATGSMGGIIAAVNANVQSFVTDLQAQGVDGQFAFAKYGDVNIAEGGDPAVITPPVFYNNAVAFAAALSAAPDSFGGGDIPESGLEAILSTVSSLPWRPAADKHMVLITDAVVHTAADGMSAATIAGTAAALVAAGVTLDVAAPLGGAQQTQLGPLATATGGTYLDIADPSFFSGGFGYTPDTTISTSEPVIQIADYDNNTFDLFFGNPPPGSVKSMTAEKSGLGLYHSWLYGGFNTAQGLDAASADLDKAMETLRTQAEIFSSGSNILTTRDSYTDNQINNELTGAENLVNADMNEEGASALMLQIREQLGTSIIGVAAKSSETVLKFFS